MSQRNLTRVEFRREGGFAGIPLTAELDAGSLPPDEAAALRELLDSADFFSLPAVIVPPRAGADQFQYVITVEADGQRHTVRTTDPAPPALHKLLDFLMRITKGRRAKDKD